MEADSRKLTAVVLAALSLVCADHRQKASRKRGREGDPGLAAERPRWEGEPPMAAAWIPESVFPPLSYSYFCGKSTGVCLRVNPPV